MRAVKRGGRRHNRRGQSERRGVVLLIVLALLGLFCAVGVSFAMLARSEGRGALDFRRTRQGYDGPAPRELLKAALDQLISDSTNPQSSIRGHSLLRDMYGGWDRAVRTGTAPNYIYSPAGIGAELRMNPDGTTRDYMGAFNGTGVFPPRKVSDPSAAGPDPRIGIGNGALTENELKFQVGRLFVPREFGALSSDPIYGANAKNWFPLLPYNFQIFDQIGIRPATAPIGGTSANPGSGSQTPLQPELYAYVDGSGWHYHWFPFDEDYDAPDQNNWFLAMERADGTVIVPSFHRPHLVRQLELAGVFGGNPNTFPAYTSTAAEDEPNGIVSGRRILFRPRQFDVDANTVLGTGLPANFPTLRDLNGNGIFGDVPEELDVDTDGDGKPDAVWVDLGVRPFRQEDGTLVKPLFAFKVVAMDGKVNANLAGNFIADPTSPTPQSQLGVPGHPEGHVSSFGASPADINPRHIMTLDQQDTASNPSYDGSRGPYWPIWEQPNPGGTPAYLDPIYLRLLLCGLPPLSGGNTAMPAVAQTAPDLYPVYVAGRWSNPNAATPNRFVLDRPGQRFTDDDFSRPAAYNANIPNEPTTVTATMVRGTVSSSLGPVGFQAGKRYPPFSRRATALGSGVGQVFPKFVNHVHGDSRDGRAYWPGYDPTSIGSPAPTPALAPVLNNGTTGEFDVPGSMNIPAPLYPFDLSNFGLAATGFAVPTPATNWFPTPGVLAYNNASFPAFLQEMQLVMTTDDANEINPYQATSSYNSLFTNSQIEQLLRFSDIDSSTLDDRALRLLTFNLGAESRQVVGTPYQFNAVQAVRERMRHMWTAESWDLILYNNPPTFGDPLNTPGLTYTGSATTLDSRNGPMPNDAWIYSSAFGTANPPYGVNAPQNGYFQHNGKLWTPPVADWPDATGPLGYAFSAGTSLKAALGAELAGRYPLEVYKGRRYDLNRPLTSYESQPTQADAERTAMAEQLYVLLYLSAGLNMRPQPTSVAEAREAFAQARTLAQLAVNIVDYIDPDNVMTTMRFNPFLTCPTMTVAPGGTFTTAATQWDAIETLLTTNSVTFNFAGGVTLPGVRPEELSVMGFEMPDLVINEGVAVTTDLPETPPTMPTNEVTFVWAELFNPWPNETDLDSGAATVAAPTPRGRLFDPQPAVVVPGRRSNAQSRFVLGVRQNNALLLTHAPTAPLTGDFHRDGANPTNRYVYFAVPGAGVTSTDGTFTTPRTLPNNGPDIRGGQRLFVEPMPYDNGASMAVPPPPNDPGSLIQGWAAASGPNRFTCTPPSDTERDDPNGYNDLRIVRPRPMTKDDSDANVVVSLYRIRNPYLNWNADTNPYVAIDTLELKGNNTDQNIARGLYDTNKTAAMPAVAARKSMERKQPWQGSQRPWIPYRGATTNPMQTLVDTTTTPPRFLEGKFLGFPYLTADATTGAVNPSMTTPTFPTWGNQLIADGFERSTNGPVGNTLYGAAETTATPYATNFTATQNTQDAALPANNSRYMSFPFLNRQLATPLELLSVRLYGSYPWAVPGSTLAGQDREWRMRFTDDFEFRQDTANAQTGAVSGYPALPNGGFNRVYRSREVPWFLNDRKQHPIDLAPLAGYDPAAGAGMPAESKNRLAPFPNLYRFFELVETHSRVNGAGGWNTLAASSAAGGTADLREARVAGKINPNPIADEEIFKAWIDDEAAMPFLTQNSGFKDFTNAGIAAPLQARDDQYRPINYPVELSSTFGATPPGAVKAIGWVGNQSELMISGVSDSSTNKSFVTSSTAPNDYPIDFGGLPSTAVFGNPGAQSPWPGGDLSTPAYNYKLLIHNQFPGIINGQFGFNAGGGALTGLYPGWDREVQVSSDFFREFVFSRNGRDALWGTADDKPFHSFASAYLADTLLRRRNYAALDFPNDARYGSTASPAIQGSSLTMYGTSPPGAPGEYITRLGGQWTPRLFDPVPLPYVLDGNPASTTAIGPTNTITMARRADVAPAPGGGPPNAVEYWMLEWRRNELLGKIAANTTSRSNVFGVWITVGYFRVEPGTENLLVPLLHEEVGSTTGTQKRHRMFAILDRTQAKQFTELMTTSPPKLEDNAVVRHYSFIE